MFGTFPIISSQQHFHKYKIPRDNFSCALFSTSQLHFLMGNIALIGSIGRLNVVPRAVVQASSFKWEYPTLLTYQMYKFQVLNFLSDNFPFTITAWIHKNIETKRSCRLIKLHLFTCNSKHVNN